MSFYSTFYFKQLYNDGARWAFQNFSRGSYYLDAPYLRHSTILNQIPSIISVWLGADLQMSVWLYCLGYMIYPFVGLAVCCWLMKEKENIDFLWIPVLPFFFCIIPSWAFSVSVTNEALTLGLIQICYLISRDKPNHWIVLILSGALTFSYEMGVLFNPLFIYILWREKKLNYKLFFSIVICAAFSSYNLMFRLIPEDAHRQFGNSLKISLHTVWIYIPLSVIWLLFDYFGNRFLKSISVILSLLVLYFVISKLLVLPMTNFWYDSYHSRTWAIPATCFLVLFLYEFLTFKKSPISEFSKISLIILFVPALFLEWHIVKGSVLIANRFRNIMSSQEGCVVLKKDEWGEFVKDVAISDWTATELSILFGASYKPRTIVFVDMYDIYTRELIPNDFCQLHDGKIVINNSYATTKIQTNQRFDFSYIYPKQVEKK